MALRVESSSSYIVLFWLCRPRSFVSERHFFQWTAPIHFNFHGEIRKINPHIVLGAEITITRKGQDNYCFVEFASIDEAKNFMAKYNHQPLRECQATKLVSKLGERAEMLKVTKCVVKISSMSSLGMGIPG